MALTCAVNVTGTALGTLCVSYASCDATCCTQAGCSGTNNSDACVSYASCGTTCCTKTWASCTGTTTGCTGKTNAQCTAAGACCEWKGTPASCKNVTCVGMSQGNCDACPGCAGDGTCSKRACSSRDCSDCNACNCTHPCDCHAKTCATLATTNLLLCAGCNTCAGNIATLSGAVDLTSYWSVYVGSLTPPSSTDTISVDATRTLNIGY